MAGGRGQEEVLRELTQRGASFLQGRRYKLYLFGSRARGDASPRSDDDMVLQADPPLDLATLARVREAPLAEKEYTAMPGALQALQDLLQRLESPGAEPGHDLLGT